MVLIIRTIYNPLTTDLELFVPGYDTDHQQVILLPGQTLDLFTVVTGDMLEAMQKELNPLVQGGQLMIIDTVDTATFNPVGGTVPTPAGSNGDVQFNNAGAFGADTGNFDYNLGTQILTVNNISDSGSGLTLVNSTDPMSYIQIIPTTSVSIQSSGFIDLRSQTTVESTLIVANGQLLLENANATAAVPILFYDNSGIFGDGFAVTLSAPATLSSSYSLNLPTAQGAAGTFLQNDGAGNLTFAPAVTSPAGSNFQLQYNNSGTFGASPDLTFTDVGNNAPNTSGSLKLHGYNPGATLTLDSDSTTNVNFLSYQEDLTWGAVTGGPDASGKVTGLGFGTSTGIWNFTKDGAIVLNALTTTQRDALGTDAQGTVTVSNYAALAGAVLTINGFALTEGTDWSAANSNDFTAESIVNAINHNNGSTTTYAVISGNLVYILAVTPGTSGNSITLTTSDATNLAVSGATLTGGNFIPPEGSMIWNSTTHLPNWYDGSGWKTFVAVSA